MTTEKKKQSKKPGHVIRVSDKAYQFIKEKKVSVKLNDRETVDFIVDQLVDLATLLDVYHQTIDEQHKIIEEQKRAKTYFILPESRIVCDSIEDARGKAILVAVKGGKKKPTEKPVVVREVL